MSVYLLRSLLCVWTLVQLFVLHRCWYILTIQWTTMFLFSTYVSKKKRRKNTGISCPFITIWDTFFFKCLFETCIISGYLLNYKNLLTWTCKISIIWGVLCFLFVCLIFFLLFFFSVSKCFRFPKMLEKNVTLVFHT